MTYTMRDYNDDECIPTSYERERMLLDLTIESKLTAIYEGMLTMTKELQTLKVAIKELQDSHEVLATMIDPFDNQK